jgi:RecB family exonuclease
VTDYLRLRDLPVGVEEANKWKNLADRLLAGAHPGTAPVVDEDGAEDAAVHREFCRHLTEAVELGSGEVSGSELWQRFSAARITPRAVRRPGKVLVTGIDRVPERAYAHVVIGGLSAAELPRRGSGEVLEGDSVVRAMSRLGIVVDQEQHAREERRAFYLAATAAGESLTLTRQGTSDEGAPVRESVFWDEFLDLYRVPGGPLPECEPPLLRVARLDAGARCGGPRRPRGQLRDDASISDLTARTEELSPSQIETYLTCPYRWFIERMVRAESPDVTLDRAAAGRIAHDALARFYRAWRERAPRVTPESCDEAMRTAAEAVAAATGATTCAGTLEEAALVGAVGPSVVALVGRDATFLPRFEPAHVEWAFGGGSDLPAIDIGGVALKGRADRIDVGPEGLIVVDYKRTHASTLAQIRREGLVQLQLYAAAASRVLGVPVAGGLYRSLKDGSDRGFVLRGVEGEFKAADVLERDELDALLEAALESARRVADEMRDGRIEPTPSAEACRYCSASAFCGKAVTS